MIKDLAKEEKNTKRRKVTEEKPEEDWLISVQGKCRFCGQYMALEVPGSFSETDIEEEATRHCDCPEAKAYSGLWENIANTEGMIKDFFEGRDDLTILKDMLLTAVQPLAEHNITKITISKGSYTGTMKPSKEGIKLSLKYSTEDVIES